MRGAHLISSGLCSEFIDLRETRIKKGFEVRDLGRVWDEGDQGRLNLALLFVDALLEALSVE